MSTDRIAQTPAAPKPKPAARYGVLVVFADGSMEYARRGSTKDGPLMACGKREAKEHRDFLRIGLDGDSDVQSVNVVRLPRRVR